LSSVIVAMGAPLALIPAGAVAFSDERIFGQRATQLVNAGAEAGPAAVDDREVVPLPGWKTTGGFTAVQYGSPGGFPDAVQAPGGGRNFFAGGPGSRRVSTASQTVDVVSRAAAIDGGGVRVTLSALIGGLLDRGDSGVVEAVFLRRGGSTAGKLTIGPVTAADRAGKTRLLSRSGSARVPAGTRSIRVVMTARRVTGSYNDAYFDNLRLALR
jgi:hypothetical protein